jgi:uncharacterized membrane protein
VSRESLVFTLGCIVFLTPFLGIPNDWKEIVLIVSGFLLMLFGYLLRRAAYHRSIDAGSGERRGDAFVESMHDRSDAFLEIEEDTRI